MQSWEMRTYSHSGIELYIHIYMYIMSVKHKTAQHQSKLTLKFYLLPILYDQAIRPRVDVFILLKPRVFFRGKMTLVDWHNHDNRLENNNQIKLKTDLSVFCKYM